MNKLTSIIVITGSLIFSSSVLAEEGSPWKADAELGFIKTGGNTETETLNLKGNVSNSNDARTHIGKVESTRTKDASGTTADRLFLSGKSEFNLDATSYLFGLITYEDDKFSGYDQVTTETAGYGRKLITDDTLKLKAEIGAGAKQAKLTAGGDDDSGIVRAAAELEWLPAETATVTEELSVESGGGITVTKSITALKNSVSNKLSSKISYTYKHTSDVAPGIKNSDTELAVTLVYTF